MENKFSVHMGYTALCQSFESTDIWLGWGKLRFGPMQVVEKFTLEQLWKITSLEKKSHIRETLNLSNDADSSTNTKTDKNGQRGPSEFFLFFFFFFINFIYFFGGSTIFVMG